MLAAAAFALPGLSPPAARAAEDDDFTFQYGRYQEGERDLSGVHSDFDPIHVDSLSSSFEVTLLDRLQLTFEWTQDTWSGATPITTAPRAFGGNRPSSPDGVSGATPFIDGDLLLDSRFVPLRVDAFGQVIGPDDRMVDTLSSASPETRDQVDLELGWSWDEASLRFGGGISHEDDYESIFTRVGGTLGFDQNRTTLDFGLHYAASDTTALLDNDTVPYIDMSAYRGDIEVLAATGDRELTDDRDDFGANLGLTRVVNANALVELGVGFARASGYLANPYKVMEVAFIDPAQQFLAPPGGYYTQVRALLEERPDRRDQWTADLRWVQFIEPFGASLHVGYRFFDDDWGIDAHTLEASWDQPLPGGWLVTPRVRYYSQSRADFYNPYLVSDQAFVTIVSDPNTGDIISITPFDPRLLPKDFSSDWRLSAFGAVSGGVTIEKQLARGVTLAADFEYYAHRGGLRLGADGDAFNDFDAYTLGATVTLDSTALHALGYRSPRRHDVERHAARGHAPAGVMLAHMLDEPGEVMTGVRYTAQRQGGSMLHGTSRVNGAEVVAAGCEGIPCRSAPEEMDANMVMLELGYAPTHWLNLMLMPQFVNMTMDLQDLPGAPASVHGAHDHSTGGVGDTGVFALVRLYDDESNHVHLGLGLSVPTGEVDLEFRRSHQQDRGFVHYGMQLGSGTWDLLPSVTWTAGAEPWSFGAQISGARRLGNENEAGYALGDALSVSAWTGYALTDWLALTARGVYSDQGSLEGEYDGAHDDAGPMDFPSNYGGEYWDLGLGIELTPRGFLGGNRLSVEWLEPLQDDVNGYQLERDGALSAYWTVEF